MPRKRKPTLWTRARRLARMIHSTATQPRYWVSVSNGTTGEHWSGEYTPLELRLMEARGRLGPKQS